jgi:ABC-2 type transport system ATP-binding protein
MNSGITLTHVSQYFGSIIALDNVSFTLKEGALYGLLGGSGAGKTTLMRLLVGSLVATKGEVRVVGYNPAQDFRKVRANLGFMPQEDALYDDLTAFENVLFFWRGRNRHASKVEAEKILVQCGLEDRLHDVVATFSGGMRRRVSLACALAGRPKLLILDEPTAALDPLLRHEMWQLLAAHAKAGATIVVSTHQIEEARYCRELLLLQDGQLITQCTPNELAQKAPGATIDEQVQYLLRAHKKEVR